MARVLDLTPEATKFLAAYGGIEIALKYRYYCGAPLKFGGKKHKNSNSGQAGRAVRRRQRATTVSAHTSPEQFRRWKAMDDANRTVVVPTDVQANLK